jgi:hypothetical protein
VTAPSFHDELPQDPAAAEAEAIRRIDEISTYFREYQVAAPILTVQRLAAVRHLQKTYSIPQIAKLVNVAEGRVREIVKSRTVRGRKKASVNGDD